MNFELVLGSGESEENMLFNLSLMGIMFKLSSLAELLEKRMLIDKH